MGGFVCRVGKNRLLRRFGLRKTPMRFCPRVTLAATEDSRRGIRVGKIAFAQFVHLVNTPGDFAHPTES
jgi:hypothetical protein